MSIALEVTLIAVLAALAVGLVPLLFQLRKTARHLDAFLLSSQKDLSRIAKDLDSGARPRAVCARDRVPSRASPPRLENRLVHHST